MNKRDVTLQLGSSCCQALLPPRGGRPPPRGHRAGVVRGVLLLTRTDGARKVDEAEYIAKGYPRTILDLADLAVHQVGH